MRNPKFLFILALLLVTSCKSKTSLSDDEQAYVKTTVDLMRTRATFKPGLDSIQVNRTLADVYVRHHTTKGDYLKTTDKLAEDPKRTELVYNAVRDSTGVK